MRVVSNIKEARVNPVDVSIGANNKDYLANLTTAVWSKSVENSGMGPIFAGYTTVRKLTIKTKTTNKKNNNMFLLSLVSKN